MDNQVFEAYFKKTGWKEGRSFPSRAELSKMEDACIEKLNELAQSDKRLYNYAFNKYGNDLIKRIGFFMRQKQLLVDDKNIQKLLSSAVSFREKLKAFDRKSYERYLRESIERGKRCLNSQTPDKCTIEAKPVVVEKDENPEIKHFDFNKKQDKGNVILKDNQAEILYDCIVRDGFLEDTSKEDFIYYFTGKGKKAQKKLKWRGNHIVLSVLLEQLFEPDKIDWDTAYSVFENLPMAMKITLSKKRKEYNEMCKTYKNNPKLIKCAFKNHRKLVSEWLTESRK